MKLSNTAICDDPVSDDFKKQACYTLDPIMDDQSPCLIQTPSPEGDAAEGEASGDDPPSSRRADPATLARFWSKVNKNGPVPIHRPELGACWLWTASCLKGYGQFTESHSHVYAHRFVRPSHIFAGTPAQNLTDARQKGRLIDGLGARKLSDDAYRDILSTTARGSGRAMARKYGVSFVTISRIRNGHQGSTFHGGQLDRTEASA